MPDNKSPFDHLLDTVDAGLSGLESAMGVIRNSDDSDDDMVPDPMVIDVTPSRAKALGTYRERRGSPLPRIMDIIRERINQTILPDVQKANIALDLSMAIAKVLDE